MFNLGCSEAKLASEPVSLRVSENFTSPLGFYDSKPTFSWNLPTSNNGLQQTAYQIVAGSDPDLLPEKADFWNSEKVTSSQSAWIKYSGTALGSRQRVYWQVRYWDQEGQPSEWSKTESFELGLLDNSDWSAKWIGLPTAEEEVTGEYGDMVHRPQYLRKDFDIPSDVTQARLYITAKGVFDVHLNAKDISDDVMPPGWTPYDERIETITYDVTDLLSQGPNTIGVELAPGWHSGRLGWQKSNWSETPSPKVLCQLEMIHSDGSKSLLITDHSWKATTDGPIRRASIYDGELYDARKELEGWTSNGYEDSDWSKVLVEDIDPLVDLQPKRHHTVKPKIHLEAKKVEMTDGEAVFDLEQNMVGVSRLQVPMKKGDTLKVRFSEMLSPDGTFYTDNYRSALSTDYYIADKTGVIDWMPKFTFHGFRYVALSGYDLGKTPTEDWVTGVVQYSDFDQNGSFSSSHEKLNQLQSNIQWGLRGNFFDVPTDCPQRDERLGWTGDAQVFGPTSLFNAEVYSFWASWLQSVRESQYKNGGIPFVVPDVLQNNKVSSGWGDACTIIPWELYRYTGDRAILEDNYEMMKKWVHHHKESTTDLISHMNSFADWLQPFPETGNTRGDTSPKLIGTAFFGYSAKLTALTAEVLGREREAKEYWDLYNAVATAFDQQFFNADGEVTGVEPTQTAYLLALAFDLIPDNKRAKAGEHLVAKINEADNHLRTGFLGTPLLAKVLDQLGHPELMYTLLFKETYPSWFYSINQGATTIWERWNSYSKTDGFNPQRMNSLNHYAYGAIGQWMYERIAGIAPIEAGYKKIRIAPFPHEPLTTAKASVNTTYGEVKSSWQIEGNLFVLKTTVPQNTTASIELPTTSMETVMVNDEPVKNNYTVRGTGKGKTLSFEVEPGTYHIKCQLDR
ncbi:rhamnosidase [Echinicola strongylocentroti]|uniref:alpha-L-rhamnosidase n=2 Tax=Echinicola strongylocentroti TaxID=1795355 RepID=A0A2Z4IQ58_9BACT|nr:rhamnosidase [Echinicola strongylocentroti]